MTKTYRPEVASLTLLLSACSSPVQYGEGRYANCEDLGEIALQSRSREDAEDRMRVQVAERGGDTLLISERGRTEQLNETPREIVARRDIILEGATTITFEQASDADGERPPPVLPPSPTTDAELWYYGAALRCALIKPE